MRQLFDTGESLFRQGDPSDFAVLLLSGSADVLRDAGEDAIVLGQVHAGEVVGEMGVLEEQPRSATVRAASPVEAELIERQAFLDRVSGDPGLARKLLVRMSARLRDVDTILADLYAAKSSEEPAHGALAAVPPRLEASPWVMLAATTAAARSLMGAEPLAIVQLPSRATARRSARARTRSSPVARGRPSCSGRPCRDRRACDRAASNDRWLPTIGSKKMA